MHAHTRYCAAACFRFSENIDRNTKHDSIFFNTKDIQFNSEHTAGLREKSITYSQKHTCICDKWGFQFCDKNGDFKDF